MDGASKYWEAGFGLFLSLAITVLPSRPQSSAARAQNAAGQQFIQQKRYGEARRAFQRAIAMQPDFPEALENLAILDVMMRSEADAQSTARKLLALDPQNYNAHLTLGITLLYENKNGEAAGHFNELYRASNRDPLVLAGLIECNSRLNRPAEAERARRILGRINIDPRDALLSAQVFQHPPLHQYVLAWLEQATRSSPTFYPLYPVLGSELLARGEIPEALYYFHQALTLKPDDATVLLTAYRAEMKAGDRSEALNYLHAASEAVKSNPAALPEYVTILVENRMFLDARAAVETALRSSPEDAHLHYLLGASLLGTNEFAKAIGEFEESLQIDPDLAESWIGKGAADLLQGTPETALRQFRRAAALDPNSGAASFYIGQCLRRLNQPNDAILALKRAIRLAPDDGRPYAELGAILLSQHRLSEAEQMLRRALSLNGDLASAHYQLGILLRNKGENEASSLQLHAAKDLREREAQQAALTLLISNQ